MTYPFRYLCIVIGMLLSIQSLAQEEELGTEVVNIVKPYTPTISDAFKVKETPVLDETTTPEKKPVSYQIFSVPVASTFTPAKGQATKVEKPKPMKLYDNYATLGFGNYTSVLGELFSSFEISRTDNANLFFKHNSSQGGIDEVLLDNKFYDTELSGSYRSRQREVTYGLDAGIHHQVYNWYGLSGVFNDIDATTIASIDPQQTYFGINVGGSVQLEDSFFKSAQATLYYTTDAFSSSEINFVAAPEFIFPLTEFNLRIAGELDFLSGSFEENYFTPRSLEYGLLKTGLHPSLVYTNDDLTLSLGAKIVLGLDIENIETDFFIYPNIQASYRLVDEVLIVYGGAEGGLDPNTYRESIAVNPFMSPTLQLTPTSQLYNAFAGLKGKISNSVGYNVRGSYGREENKALIQQNPFKGFSDDFKGYEHGNSFGLTYDDVNTLNIFGELTVAISDDFSLGATANLNSYSLDNQQEAWNLPELEASVFSNFKVTEKVYGGVSLFFVGERKDTQGEFGPDIQTVESFFDANVDVGYHVNDRLSIFAKGSNLLGKNYERWLNYPVLGIQGLLGATYKFDW